MDPKRRLLRASHTAPPTWTDFEDRCRASRVKGGVHFVDAGLEGVKQGRQVGAVAWDFFRAHVDGTID